MYLSFFLTCRYAIFQKVGLDAIARLRPVVVATAEPPG
jgi:hypothetical protein